jgi:hypothetical protein
LALDTILQKPVKGIPSWLLNIMEHAVIERLAGFRPGDYAQDPDRVYLAMQKALGTCMIDQWIPRNPLEMGSHGYENAALTATTGLKHPVLDGITIDSPEAVVEHLEKIIMPQIRGRIQSFDEEARVREIVAGENRVQEALGPEILKTGYWFVKFPHLRYGEYGYENYFLAYALYPEVMDKLHSLDADLWILHNRAAARAYREGNLPPYCRLDFDFADNRSLLADVKSLDRVWLPHFARALEPLLKTDVRMIWHCDGNLMDLVPRLLDIGLKGFQGFQYECGMDYEKICQMKTKDGDSLLIIGGVSVTRTLPQGSPEDVKKEMKWLVDHGPKTGLFLGASSSIAPGVPWENIKMLAEGLKYYQEHGRG